MDYDQDLATLALQQLENMEQYGNQSSLQYSFSNQIAQDHSNGNSNQQQRSVDWQQDIQANNNYRDEDNYNYSHSNAGQSNLNIFGEVQSDQPYDYQYNQSYEKQEQNMQIDQVMDGQYKVPYNQNYEQIEDQNQNQFSVSNNAFTNGHDQVIKDLNAQNFDEQVELAKIALQQVKQGNFQDQQLQLQYLQNQPPSRKISKDEYKVLQIFLSKLQSAQDVDLYSQQMQKIFVQQLTTKQRQLSENLYHFFKDQIEILYSQIEIQEWSGDNIVQEQETVVRGSLVEIFQNLQRGDEHQARQKLSQLNDYLSTRQKGIESLLDDVYLKMRNALEYSIQSMQKQIILEDTIHQFFMQKEKEKLQLQNEAIEKQKMYKSALETNGQPDGVQHLFYNVKRTNSKSAMRKVNYMTKLENPSEFGAPNLDNIKCENGTPTGGGNYSREQIKLIKREDDLKKTFNLTSQEMECFSNFEQAENFIKQRILNNSDFIVLTSTFKKVQQIFVLKKYNGKPKVHEVHLINQESVIQLHFTCIAPCYLMITMALYVTTVRLRVILINCQNGEILMKKDLVSPNPSQFKTYYNDPYFCILYGRAKLLLIDVSKAILGQQLDFQEIQTCLNFKSNYKIQIQPLMGRGPSDLLGFHYSSQGRMNEIYQFGMQTVQDPVQLKSWRAQNDSAVDRQINETGKLMVMNMKKTDIKENEIPNKTYNYGTIALGPDKILIIGGISEQQGTSRDQCYVYDLKTKCIDKCAELFLKMKDAFANDNYSYFEDEQQYVVAGRFYVHCLNKALFQWETVDAYLSEAIPV
ncbi:UNKNOWN [Stylonychia lemnae]|uniref:Kelch motif family protein n=1 Tax=Stylonychia lemnae TaxID=5949 RepID=A0A077ZSH3_STYLE|nr:UNKNOWN [Stylonychia lemnae]|eukprot:CDW72823.1 UNKNOWN [Stylonychia lemnae]